MANGASQVAAIPAVREALLSRQQAFREAARACCPTA